MKRSPSLEESNEANQFRHSEQRRPTVYEKSEYQARAMDIQWRVLTLHSKLLLE